MPCILPSIIHFRVLHAHSCIILCFRYIHLASTPESPFQATMLLRSSAQCFIDRLLAQRIAEAASCSYAGYPHLRGFAGPSSSSDQPAGNGSSQQIPQSASGSAQSTPSPSSPGLEGILKLQKTSPTGRLLDLFLNSPASSASPKRKPQDSVPSSGPALPQHTSQNADPSKDVILTMVQAVEHCKPLMKVMTVKKGSRVVHVPLPIPPRQQMQLSVKWIVQAAKKRKESSDSSMAECLAYELLLSAQKKGNARTKRDDMHKIAAENRANVLTGFR